MSFGAQVQKSWGTNEAGLQGTESLRDWSPAREGKPQEWRSERGRQRWPDSANKTQDAQFRLNFRKTRTTVLVYFKQYWDICILIDYPSFIWNSNLIGCPVFHLGILVWIKTLKGDVSFLPWPTGNLSAWLQEAVYLRYTVSSLLCALDYIVLLQCLNYFNQQVLLCNWGKKKKPMRIHFQVVNEREVWTFLPSQIPESNSLQEASEDHPGRGSRSEQESGPNAAWKPVFDAVAALMWFAFRYYL